jgi:Icc-related predicted phosphoesterase
LERFKRQIADTGSYPFETSTEEQERYREDAAAVDRLFHKLVLERVRHWTQLADERLSGSGVRCLVSGGNDDFFEVDEVLAASEVVEDPNCRLVELDGFELIGLGYANPTPWNCPRDISEEEISVRVEEVARQLRRPERAIFSLHVPPHGSGLDMAPKLDPELRVVKEPGSAEPQMVPVGSTAVRDAILRYQPMLGLHGHVHESRGMRKLGTTTVVNPGSEYQEGLLDGALIDLDQESGVLKVQLVSG